MNIFAIVVSLIINRVMSPTFNVTVTLIMTYIIISFIILTSTVNHVFLMILFKFYKYNIERRASSFVDSKLRVASQAAFSLFA